MSEHTPEPRQRQLEERSRALFHGSVDDLDMAMRSRLTRARYAALEATGPIGRRAWFARIPIWTSAAGVTAAAALGFALWFGSPAGHHGMMSADNPMNLEDLELVASVDENAGDTMEMLQDDLEFYDWADKAASTEPAAEEPV
jgi:hypothetical protein